MSPWSYVAGKPARGGVPSSRVRIYERAGTSRVYISRAWIRTPSGDPEARPLPDGVTREQAERIADAASLERRKAIIEQHPTERGRVQLAALLARYHASAKADKWSTSHRREQERLRKLWLSELGGDTPVHTLTPERVENAAARISKARKWKGGRSERKVLAYMKAVTRFGHRKAKLLTDDPLSGVDLPEHSPETSDLIYSEQEVALLCTGRDGIDWRTTLAANIAADTGRRIGTIRRLETRDVGVTPDGRVLLHIRPELDKKRREAAVPVSVETADLILEALKRPEVQAHGWLFPGGPAGTKHRAEVPLGGHDPTGSGIWADKLHEAETALGIPSVQGRAFHGIKRRHVTVAGEESGGDWALVGDLTGNRSSAVLEQVYRQSNADRSAAHVDRVRARFQPLKVAK